MTGIVWTGVLTGAPDSLPDLVLQMLNFQATLRDSTASYIQVVIPFEQYDDVLARPNGQIVINKTLIPDNVTSELYRVNFSDARSNEGARHRKLTISGRSTASFPAPKAVTLVGVVSDDIQASGARAITVSPFNNVVPGDTVTYAGTPTVIELVEITAGQGQTTMQVTEA